MDFLLERDPAIHNPHQRNDADEVVEPGIDDQRLERPVWIAFRRRDMRDDRFQQIGHRQSGLGADPQRLAGVQPDDVADLARHPLRVGGRQVDLVEHRQDFEPLLDGGVAVGDTLRLDTLRDVHHQQRTLAGGQRTRYLVGKIHMPRRVDDVELVGLAVAGRVAQRHALCLDGDAALPLQIHRVEHLLGHFPRAQPAANLDEAIGQRGFTVVDVRDD